MADTKKKTPTAEEKKKETESEKEEKPKEPKPIDLVGIPITSTHCDDLGGQMPRECIGSVQCALS